jgi:hypothetical protein
MNESEWFARRIRDMPDKPFYTFTVCQALRMSWAFREVLLRIVHHDVFEADGGQSVQRCQWHRQNQGVVTSTTIEQFVGVEFTEIVENHGIVATASADPVLPGTRVNRVIASIAGHLVVAWTGENL